MKSLGTKERGKTGMKRRIALWVALLMLWGVPASAEILYLTDPGGGEVTQAGIYSYPNETQLLDLEEVTSEKAPDGLISIEVEDYDEEMFTSAWLQWRDADPFLSTSAGAMQPLEDDALWAVRINTVGLPQNTVSSIVIMGTDEMDAVSSLTFTQDGQMLSDDASFVTAAPGVFRLKMHAVESYRQENNAMGFFTDTKIDISGLSLGQSMTVDATVLYGDDAFQIEVTKEALLREAREPAQAARMEPFVRYYQDIGVPMEELTFRTYTGRMIDTQYAYCERVLDPSEYRQVQAPEGMLGVEFTPDTRQERPGFVMDYFYINASPSPEALAAGAPLFLVNASAWQEEAEMVHYVARVDGLKDAEISSIGVLTQHPDNPEGTPVILSSIARYQEGGSVLYLQSLQAFEDSFEIHFVAPQSLILRLSYVTPENQYSDNDIRLDMTEVAEGETLEQSEQIRIDGNPYPLTVHITSLGTPEAPAAGDETQGGDETASGSGDAPEGAATVIALPDGGQVFTGVEYDTYRLTWEKNDAVDHYAYGVIAMSDGRVDSMLSPGWVGPSTINWGDGQQTRVDGAIVDGETLEGDADGLELAEYVNLDRVQDGTLSGLMVNVVTVYKNAPPQSQYVSLQVVQGETGETADEAPAQETQQGDASSEGDEDRVTFGALSLPYGGVVESGTEYASYIIRWEPPANPSAYTLGLSLVSSTFMQMLSGGWVGAGYVSSPFSGVTEVQNAYFDSKIRIGKNDTEFDIAEYVNLEQVQKAVGGNLQLIMMIIPEDEAFFQTVVNLPIVAQGNPDGIKPGWLETAESAEIAEEPYVEDTIVDETDEDEVQPTEAPQDADAAETLGTITVTSGANIRSGGSTDFPVLGKVSSGETYEVVDIADSGWYGFLWTDGQMAYVSPKMVTFQSN